MKPTQTIEHHDPSPVVICRYATTEPAMSCTEPATRAVITKYPRYIKHDSACEHHVQIIADARFFEAVADWNDYIDA